MEDKATDTLDDLHKIDYKYYLDGNSKKTKSNEKLRGDFTGQVNTVPVIEKDDENKDRENSDDENLLGRVAKKGFRLAELALNSSIAGANLTMSLADIIAEATLLGNNQEEEESDNDVEYVTSNTSQGNSQAIAIAIMNNPHINENDLEVVSVNSSPPMTVSSVTPPHTVHSSTASSLSVPTSPQSIPVPTSPQSRASSRSSRSNLYNPKKKK